VFDRCGGIVVTGLLCEQRRIHCQL
jgi:hypothetical protein